MYDPDILLPGPTRVPPAVTAAMTAPMSDHRGPEFDRLRQRATERLRQLLKARALAIFPGSGTATLEAAVQNFFEPGEQVLSVSGGAFGLRLREAARTFGLAVEALDVPWGQAAHPEQVVERLRQAIREGRPLTGLLLTHNETSTGVLNPIPDIIEAVHQAIPREHWPLTVVDSVSGFPSVPLPMDSWQVDVALVGSQKGLMLPPGLAIVGMSGRALERTESVRGPRFYLDVRPYVRGELPYTPAVSLWHGLDATLTLLEEEGEVARYRRHRILRDVCRAFARTAGFGLPVDAAVASPTVTLLTVPEPWTPAALRRALRAQGVEAAGGMGPFAQQGIRLGHMGYLTLPRLMGALAALGYVLEQEAGLEGRGQAALAEALQAWKQAEVAESRTP